MTKFSRTSTGKYAVAGKTYESLIGTRAQVWHGTAYKTAGGLHKVALKMHRGRIVSKKKSEIASTQKHLSGHLQPKGSGVFGTVTKKGSKKRGTRKHRSHKK
jgi:hypothetical protein